MRILEKYLAYVESFNTTDKGIVPVDVTSVAEWYFTSAEIELINLREMIPCVVSPFDVALYEYRIPRFWKVMVNKKWVTQEISPDMGGGKRIGMLTIQKELADDFIESNPIEKRLFEDLRTKLSDYKPPKFHQTSHFFIATKDLILNPLSCDNYIDSDGRLLGGNYSYTKMQGDDEAMTFIRAYGYSIYFAISMLHCKNVSVKDDPIPVKVAKKRARKGWKNPMYKTIVIDSLKKQIRSDKNSGAEGQHILRALDLVRGHFKEYKEKGLFGKYFGRYWWSNQVIVNRDVQKEYKIVK